MKVHSYATNMNLNKNVEQNNVETQNFDFWKTKRWFFSYLKCVIAFGLLSWYNGLNAPSIFLFTIYIPKLDQKNHVGIKINMTWSIFLFRYKTASVKMNCREKI